MKYETPELTTLTLAINAIQEGKTPPVGNDTIFPDEQPVGAYQDWE